MNHDGLQHDTAWAASQAILETVAHLLREEEHHDARCEFYRIVKTAIECYDIQSQREVLRLRHSAN
jgi:hypothetical protein